jgi:hypothetical protein
MFLVESFFVLFAVFSTSTLIVSFSVFFSNINFFFRVNLYSFKFNVFTLIHRTFFFISVATLLPEWTYHGYHVSYYSSIDSFLDRSSLD